MDMEIFIGSIVRKVINPQGWAYRHLQYLYRYLLSMKRSQKLKILNFDVFLTDHCNLDCAGCGAYSPLAKEAYYDKEIFKSDCARIAQLTFGKINFIQFAGGEPLLHPDITDFFDIARSYFKKVPKGGGGGLTYCVTAYF
jgi:MoaA/NifB/PqqE/SkfB family radical SAM enzyme